MAVEVGSKYQGRVTGITHFGAFVELPGGETGMVHISEISNNYVKDIRDFLNVNDIVTVKVLNVASDGKIGLSIRRAQEDGGSRPPRRERRSGDRKSSPSLEEMISRFMRDSEERLSSLKRQDSKRGGRGGRRA
ncbi:MAG: RNA-binding protein S1 [Bacillus thermozeamaize]|jgi:S1 RNA binding domain protein|uniref:RNA-binding protein S1 n=1 Tax=Bacillus thermozeamaize TaxID=230954 RepID=A0A1Y3PD66_9BACI|nr:MAG: RNA-binding protein S1 [Bacillus thermozeamaize]